MNLAVTVHVVDTSIIQCTIGALSVQCNCHFKIPSKSLRSDSYWNEKLWYMQKYAKMELQGRYKFDINEANIHIEGMTAILYSLQNNNQLLYET